MQRHANIAGINNNMRVVVMCILQSYEFVTNDCAQYALFI